MTPVRFDPAAPRSRVKHSTIKLTMISVKVIHVQPGLVNEFVNQKGVKQELTPV